MNSPPVSFPFIARDQAFGTASLAPLIPLRLGGHQTSTVLGLLDTGAAVNVLPYGIGEQLGFVWDQQTTTVNLTGNLASFEARVVIVEATVAAFPPVRLAFAWTENHNVPVILGQVNFFLEFDVCFFRSRSLFEVRAKGE